MDRNTTPLSPWKYFGLQILYNIPIIGFIFLVCHALGAENENKKNFARSYFCIVVVAIVIAIIVFILVGGSQFIEYLKGYVAQG